MAYMLIKWGDIYMTLTNLQAKLKIEQDTKKKNKKKTTLSNVDKLSVVDKLKYDVCWRMKSFTKSTVTMKKIK